MKDRRIARELALLSISQLPNKPDRIAAQQLQDVVAAAIRALSAEAKESLETAVAELERSSDRLLSSQTRAADLQSSRAMVQEAMELTQAAINRVGQAVEIPEFVQASQYKPEIHEYVIQVLTQVQTSRAEIDQLLQTSMVDWQVHRLVRIDQDILRIAIAEMWFLGIPEQVAINEAVELAKRYSGEDGHRFINGVLRRVSQEMASRV
jgi:transcription antitermination protein NusB